MVSLGLDTNRRVDAKWSGRICVHPDLHVSSLILTNIPHFQDPPFTMPQYPRALMPTMIAPTRQSWVSRKSVGVYWTIDKWWVDGKWQHTDSNSV